jgi:histone H3/H4
MRYKKMTEIPIAPLIRLMRTAGAERVSPQAAEVLRDILEDLTMAIANKAIGLANHAGRKTLTGDDIKLAHQFM